MQKSLYRHRIVLVVLVVVVLLFSSTSLVQATPSEKPTRVTVDMAKSELPFEGFTASLDEKGNINIRRFSDPGLLAASLNVTIDEVVNGSPTSIDSTKKVNSRVAETDSTSEVGILATRQARVNSYNLVEDVIWIDMNWLESHHTFNYNGSSVTWESLSASAWWKSETGWYLTALTRSFSGKSLPASYDWGKAYASFRNDVFPGGPYQNAIATYSYVYGGGSVSASHNFYLDQKGLNLGWRWSGWHTRDQIY